MKKSRIAAVLMAVITGVTMTNTAYAETQAVDITVSPSQEHKSISPYIYGVNTGVDLNKVSAGSMRLGGNRLSAYNWENNVSNAGSDWHHNSDMYLVNDVDEDIKNLPGSPALQLSRDADDHDIPYTLLTLQMLGYTSSDKKGTVKEDKTAPSEFWDKVVNRKGSEFTLTPDTKDGYVYMDEYINYLISNLGDSSSKTGYSIITEAGYIEIGKDIVLLTAPGEIVPQLIYGNVVSAEDSYRGTEWTCDITANLLPDEKTVLVMGLCNDAIGYIIPDNDYAPFIADSLWNTELGEKLFGEPHRHYEEMLSAGSTTGSVVTGALNTLVKEVG